MGSAATQFVMGPGLAPHSLSVHQTETVLWDPSASVLAAMGLYALIPAPTAQAPTDQIPHSCTIEYA